MGITLTLTQIKSEKRHSEKSFSTPPLGNIEVYEPMENLEVENPVLIIPKDNYRYVMPATWECEGDSLREKVRELDFLLCIVLADKVKLNGKTLPGEGDNLYGFYGNCIKNGHGDKYLVQPLTTTNDKGQEFLRICQREEILEFFTNIK